MRPAILLCLAVAFGGAANAQFTVLAQVGFENERTSIAFNEQTPFSPLGNKLCTQSAVRVDYAFRKKHGPFVGLAPSRTIVQYRFLKPETGATAYTATRGDVQFRFEGGYQVRTGPIYFKKKALAATNTATGRYHNTTQRPGCGKSVARAGCSSKPTMAKAKPVDERSWMRIVPSLGIAYIPGTPRAAIYTEGQAAQPAYQYNAGNWKTALLSGVAFEFGQAAQRKFVVGLNYLKGMSNLDTRTITTVVGNKPTTTSLKSGASAWNVLLGIPISFAKKQAAVKQQVMERSSKTEKRCGDYKTQYKGRCTRAIY